MEDFVPFGSPEYWLLFAVLLFSRAMDLLSTWVATPRLVLEGNPVIRRLGWSGGILVSLVVSGLVACVELGSIIVCTTSLLVAARNFQSAWLMRTMGEESYLMWRCERLAEAPGGLFAACLFSETILLAAVGVTLVVFSPGQLIAVGIGLGILMYALAVLFFTLLSLWRSRRSPP